jgi:flagellar hook-associated protein 2
MATLSSPGVGSGLDVNGIVNQLMAVERKPIEQLDATNKRLDAQLSAYGKLQSAMMALRDAARRLTDASTWQLTKATSASAEGVTATSTGTAPPGTYSVSVSRLAAAQTVVGNQTFASASDTLGGGTLTIELGNWDAGQTAFAPKADGSAVSITIAEGSTLTQVRDAINAAGAGVNASIVNDASGARLAIRSTSTGADNGFRITAVPDAPGTLAPAATLDTLEFDPPSGTTGMSRTLAAANAEATINGVAVSSATNLLTDVLDGLTVRLGQVTTAPVEVTVERDTESIKKAVTEFATAYNDLVSQVREQTRYDEGSKKAGTLQGDRSAVGLLNGLRSLAGTSTGAVTTFTRLADIGLEPQSDGKLKVVDSKLDGATGRLDDLQAFFARNADGAAEDGFGVLMRDFGSQALDTSGELSTRQEALRASIQRNNARSDKLEERLALVEARLRAQYSKLDTNMARLTSLQNYVSQQVQNWNAKG